MIENRGEKIDEENNYTDHNFLGFKFSACVDGSKET